MNVEFFQGDLFYVRESYFKVSRKFEADYILRIPADNPLPDHFEIDRLINFHLSENSKGFSSYLALVK